MPARTTDIRIVPPTVEFKDCDVGTALKRTVRVINFGTVGREIRFLSKPKPTSVCSVFNELNEFYKTILVNLPKINVFYVLYGRGMYSAPLQHSVGIHGAS